MVAFEDELRRTGSFMVSESNHTRSRETVILTVPAGETLSAGTVLGKISASGKYAPFDEDNGNGTEDVAGILYNTVVNDDDAPVDVQVAAVVRDAEVRLDDLIFYDDTNDADAAVAALAELGIIARPSGE